jgi:hypothetical protein
VSDLFFTDRPKGSCHEKDRLRFERLSGVAVSPRFLAFSFLAACLASAAGADLLGLAGAIAVPALAICGLGIITDIAAMRDTAAKFAFGAIGFAVAAHSIAGALRPLLWSPWGAALLGIIATVGCVVSVGRVLAAVASVKLPPRERIGRAPVRERVVIVDPVEAPFGRRPPRATRRDETGLFGDDL